MSTFVHDVLALLVISTSISIAGCAIHTERDEPEPRGKLVIKARLGDDTKPTDAPTSLKSQIVFNREVVYEYDRLYIDKTGKAILGVDYEESGDFHQGMAYVKVIGKYGYIDKDGEIVIHPQFEYAHDFVDGLASVTVSGRWGFIDQKGEYAIEPAFDFASDFGDGLAPVKIGEKFGYIGTDGQVKIQPEFDYAYSFSEGRAIVLYGEVTPIRGGLGFYFPNVKRKVIDTSGKIVTHDDFDVCDKGYYEGLLAVSRNGKWGYIDREGHITIDLQYDAALPFSNGYGIVRKNDTLYFINQDEIVLQSMDYGIHRKLEVDFYNRDGNLAPFSDLNAHYLRSCGYMDIRSGQIIVDPEYDWASRFSDGLAKVTVAVATDSTRVTAHMGGTLFLDENRLFPFEKDDYWGFSRGIRSKDIAIEPQFNAVCPFSEECAAVKLGRKWGFIDTQGRFLISPNYERAHPFSDGLAAVKVGEKWGFIDRRGEFVIDPTYDAAYSFSEGLAPVKVGRKWGFVNDKGGMEIAPAYDLSEPFVDGFAVVVTGDVKEISVEYGDGSPNLSDRTTYVVNGKWGFIDHRGNSLKSLQFDGAWFFRDRIAAVKVGSKWGFINRAGAMIVHPRFDNVEMSFYSGYLFVVESGEERKTIHSLHELLTGRK